MARCVWCDKKFKYSIFGDVGKNIYLLSKIQKYLLNCKQETGKNYGFLTESWAAINSSTDNSCFCESCRFAFYNLIEKSNEFKSSYNLLKSTVNLNKIDTISDEGKLKYLEKLNNDCIFNERKLDIQENFTRLKNDQWSIFQNKVNANFVYPILEKNSHVCATKYNNNLVLVENRNPVLNLNNDFSIENYKDTLEQISQLDIEKIFAISVIPLENIVSYQSTGYVEHATRVSGGGGYGGGVNKKGAIVGGLLFGGAGAIVGSQIGTEFFINPITSNIIEYDYRKTMLNLKNAQGQVEIKELPYYYAEVFQKVIPEKEFNFLHANKNTEVQVSVTSNNMLEEMKQLKELLDIGLITQEEFDSKRKQILKL